MLAVFMTLVMAGVTGPGEVQGAKTYAAAYRTAEKENRPLVVVVGAPWCPACENLKQTTLASMEASGELQDVSLAVVDQDKDPELARELKQGEMIPQIIVFARTDSGWKRSQLTGYQSVTPVRTMLRRAASLLPGRS